MRHARQRASLALDAGAVRLRVRVTVSPAGLLAIGGMVGTILLGSAAVVRAARR